MRNLTNLLNFVKGGTFMRKLAILGALLAMLLVASVPVLAQQAAPPPSSPADSKTTSTQITPASGSAVGCQELYGYPTAFCMVNADGLITLPDGSQAPVLVQPNGTAFIVDKNGNLIPAGTSAPPTGQYDNAKG
jgi:hypothetical protein